MSEKYDIIYYFDEFSALFQMHNKRKFGNKTAVMIHEVALFDDSLLSKFIQKRAIRNSDIVLTQTKYNLDPLKKAGINKYYEIYPGLEVHNNIPSFKNREDIAITVTMWDYGRKPEVFLEIAKYLNKGKIIIAGSWADKNYYNKFKKIIEEKKLNNKLIVTGEISEENLTYLYKRSKVSIRFGYNEKGPGMGSLESISWGIPLIINDGIGIKEKIIEEINGFIVKENESEKVARLIENLFNNETLWTEISNNNIILSKELSWDNYCKKIESIFKLVLENNKLRN